MTFAFLVKLFLMNLLVTLPVMKLLVDVMESLFGPLKTTQSYRTH